MVVLPYLQTAFLLDLRDIQGRYLQSSLFQHTGLDFRIGRTRFPQLKILLGKKERSVDFADEAVVDFYFLLTASVLALDSFVDGYFFN